MDLCIFPYNIIHQLDRWYKFCLFFYTELHGTLVLYFSLYSIKFYNVQCINVHNIFIWNCLLMVMSKIWHWLVKYVVGSFEMKFFLILYWSCSEIFHVYTSTVHRPSKSTSLDVFWTSTEKKSTANASWVAYIMGNEIFL